MVKKQPPINYAVINKEPAVRPASAATLFELLKKPRASLTLVVAVVALVAFAAAGYFWWQTRELQRNPQGAAQKELRETIKKVGELIVLPEGEEPTLATVTDPERLRDQLFFAKAKAGDKVLIYTNARKAILYDPAAHKIVEVAPLNIGAQP